MKGGNRYLAPSARLQRKRFNEAALHEGRKSHTDEGTHHDYELLQ